MSYPRLKLGVLASKAPKTLQFVATISSRGKKDLVIIIPRKYHKEALALHGRPIKVIVEDILA